MLRALLALTVVVLLGCMGAPAPVAVSVDINALGEVRIDGDTPLPMDDTRFRDLQRWFPNYEGRRLVARTSKALSDYAVYDRQGMTSQDEGISLSCGRGRRFWDDSEPAQAFSGTLSLPDGTRVSPCTESRALFDALSRQWKGPGPYQWGEVEFGNTTVSVGGAVDGSRVDGVEIYRR